MAKVKVFRCEKCGYILNTRKASSAITSCCNIPMREIKDRALRQEKKEKEDRRERREEI